jgi:hypothetical protein
MYTAPTTIHSHQVRVEQDIGPVAPPTAAATSGRPANAGRLDQVGQPPTVCANPEIGFCCPSSILLAALPVADPGS